MAVTSKMDENKLKRVDNPRFHMDNLRFHMDNLKPYPKQFS